MLRVMSRREDRRAEFSADLTASAIAGAAEAAAAGRSIYVAQLPTIGEFHAGPTRYWSEAIEAVESAGWLLAHLAVEGSIGYLVFRRVGSLRSA